ncbi:MAG: hypothetical protein H6727_17415 [Myxococcales bacterium]|nr:hypothetical protein [Myxococcales bacterium]
MQSKKATEDRVMPIALDMGRTFWVMARLDAQGQPEVASLGDQGLIAAVISSFEEEILVAQHYAEPGGLEPLMDIYKGLQGEPRWFGGDSEFVRGYGEQLEFRFGSQWYPPEELFGRLVGHVVGMVKDHCSPHEALPMVVSIPPELPASTLSRLRDLIEQHDGRLVGWCSALEATVLSVRSLREEAHVMALVAHVERGAFSLGVVELEDGYPSLLQSRTIEWPSQSPFPVERVPALVDELLLQLEEHHALQHTDLRYLLVSGEEAWVPHLEPVIAQKVNCERVHLERPQLASAMGAAALAGYLEEGLFVCAPQLQGETSQHILKCLGTPDAKLRVVRGGTGQAQIALDGRAELPVRLLSSRHDRLIVQVTAPNQGPQRLEVSLSPEESATLDSPPSEIYAQMMQSHAEEQDEWVGSTDIEEEVHGRMTSRHSGLRGVLSSSVWLELSEPRERFEMARAFTPLPLRTSHQFYFINAQQQLHILEGESGDLSPPLLYGTLSLRSLAAYAREGEPLEIELNINQDGLIEVCVRISRERSREVAGAWHRKQGKPYSEEELYPVDSGHRVSGGHLAVSSNDEYAAVQSRGSSDQLASMGGRGSSDRIASMGGRGSSDRIASMGGRGSSDRIASMGGGRESTPHASHESLASVASVDARSRRETPNVKEPLVGEQPSPAVASAPKKGKSSDPSESTQPDMEVPEELRNYDADKKNSRNAPHQDPRASSAGLTAMSPPPASSSSGSYAAAGSQRPHLSSPSSAGLSSVHAGHNSVSSASLPSMGLGPAAGLSAVLGDETGPNPFSAEGDGRTMVLSRKSLLGEGDGATMVFNKQALGAAFAEESHAAPARTPNASFRSGKPGLKEARAQQELDLPMEDEEQRRITLSVPGQRLSGMTEFEQRAVPASEGAMLAGGERFDEIDDMDILEEVNDALSGLSEMPSSHGSSIDEGDMTIISSKATLQTLMREREARLSKDKTEQHRAVDPMEHLASARTEQHRAVDPDEHLGGASFGSKSIRGADVSGGLESTMDERPSSAGRNAQGGEIMSRLEQAHRLAEEARALMDEAAAIALMADQVDAHQAAQRPEMSGDIDAGDRREVRKVLDLAEQLCEGEQSRLPSTTRKIIVRMVEEVETQLRKNSPLAMPLALRLANRIFEAVRRDLRPW